MKRSIRKFRKWIKYKFSTYYPDPCDFTIYESYAHETPIISLADSYQARWQKLSELTRFGDSRDSTTNPPLLENPLDNIKDQLDKLFGIEDSQTISLSKGISARADKLSIKGESFNKAFKKAVEKSKPLPNPKPKPPLDRSLKEGVQPIKPINNSLKTSLSDSEIGMIPAEHTETMRECIWTPPDEFDEIFK